MVRYLRVSLVAIFVISSSLVTARADLSVSDLRQQCDVTQVINKSFYFDNKEGKKGICCTNPEKSEGWCCWEKASDQYSRCARQTPQGLSAVQ